MVRERFRPKREPRVLPYQKQIGPLGPVPWKLNDQDWKEAREEGASRRSIALRGDYKHKHGGSDKDPWGSNIEGACGEMAVARFLDLPFHHSDGRQPTGMGDVGPYHVRTTRDHSWALCIHDDDPDEGIFILVTGSSPYFKIQGFAHAGCCKLPRWYVEWNRTGHPNFWAPQRERDAPGWERHKKAIDAWSFWELERDFGLLPLLSSNVSSTPRICAPACER